MRIVLALFAGFVVFVTIVGFVIASLPSDVIRRALERIRKKPRS